MRTLKPHLASGDAAPTLVKEMMPSRPRDQPTSPAIPLDLMEDEWAYTVRADIPGTKEEYIVVDADGPVVTIRADMPSELPEGPESNVLRAERFHGIKLSRTFTLPLEVDLDAMTAKYENGVLRLTLPKKPDAAPHRVTFN